MKGPSVKQSMKCKVCSKLADLPVDLNGNFRFLLLELILADLSDKISAISQILTLKT